MKLLLDTNIIIPAEITSSSDIESNTDNSLELEKLAKEHNLQLYIHPHIECDLKNDKNQNRFELRKKRLQRFSYLPKPPTYNDDFLEHLPQSSEYTNDWVDDHLILAVLKNAVDYLVTEDEGIHTKAAKLGIEENVLYLQTAIDWIMASFEKQSPSPYPYINEGLCHELDNKDPIFESLRATYKDFDRWFNQCQKNHRTCFVIRETKTSDIIALCIIKEESSLTELNLSGKILKICTFKVADIHQGKKWGEHLLKPIFEYIQKNGYEYTYLTTFEVQEGLIKLLQRFGFEEGNTTNKNGEKILFKRFKFTDSEKQSLSSSEFNIKFGPFITKFEDANLLLIPIQPDFHKLLFPEYEKEIIPQLLLFQETNYPCGNAISKAYLCHSKVKYLKKGDNIVFYRSADTKGITCLGIVEDFEWSRNPDQINMKINNRTVYPYEQLQEMCNRGEVLTILFRLVKYISPPIPRDELIENNVLKSHPQSIMYWEQAKTWLQQKLKM